MNTLKDIKKEIKERGFNENHAKRNTSWLQSAYIKDIGKCERCGNKKNLTYDHIIPCKILKMFNIDPLREFWEENSQCYCHACNTMKADNLDFSNPKTKELLLTLLK